MYFADKGVGLQEADLRKAMVDCMGQALSQIEAERKA